MADATSAAEVEPDIGAVAATYAPKMNGLLAAGCDQTADPMCAAWLTEIVQLAGEVQTAVDAVPGHNDIELQLESVRDNGEKFGVGGCYEQVTGIESKVTCAAASASVQTEFRTALTMLQAAAL